MKFFSEAVDEESSFSKAADSRDSGPASSPLFKPDVLNRLDVVTLPVFNFNLNRSSMDAPVYVGIPDCSVW